MQWQLGRVPDRSLTVLWKAVLYFLYTPLRCDPYQGRVYYSLCYVRTGLVRAFAH